ncbi:NAD(P)/FAD-dependent oxidoreductase [Geobacter pickeringii]|uniref:NAD(P)/FAD-dependent oxidoreductase n=1 Tax=Geobacter pickeringii TaxID=345632 RepID=UPI00068D548B|nr:NAD(P)/FAD-dependent oxidoreductase [Geobacter pickeringii]
MPVAEGRRNEAPVVVLGAGPAGLTAAYELSRRGVPTVLLEQDRQVGGLARTVVYRGYRFDIGGHRFFTRQAIVRGLWQTMLGDDLLVRPRLSRIYYGGKFFDYPLKPLNALRNLGITESVAVLGSYLWRKLFPIRPEASFADWVTNRFGGRLYRMFFKSYTEKVWGIPCHTIGAQWAAQRIRGLSLRTAIVNMFFPRRHQRRGETIKTLIDEFLYPRLGPGMMWEAFREAIAGQGGTISLGSRVTRLLHDGERIVAVEGKRDGEPFAWTVSGVISTIPLRHLIHALRPLPPDAVLAAADRLKYRDFLTVALIVDVAELFPDNWIYVHDETVRVGRIQNFKNWSPAMVPDGTKTCLGMEYFCAEGDDIWAMADADLVALATRELAAIAITVPEKVVDGTVVRMPKAYPVYDEGYHEAFETVKGYLERFANLQVAGRNGMHRYNNMDHSMLTAILAVRNIFGERHDLWGINADDEYLEAGWDMEINSRPDFMADEPVRRETR